MKILLRSKLSRKLTILGVLTVGLFLANMNEQRVAAQELDFCDNARYAAQMCGNQPSLFNFIAYMQWQQCIWDSGIDQCE